MNGGSPPFTIGFPLLKLSLASVPGKVARDGECKRSADLAALYRFLNHAMRTRTGACGCAAEHNGAQL